MTEAEARGAVRMYCMMLPAGVGRTLVALLDKAQAEIKRLEAENLIYQVQCRCRVCDTVKCGTMYCKRCYDYAMQVRDNAEAASAAKEKP
jgi:hypothetical protein